jgi:hypothetical protein
MPELDLPRLTFRLAAYDTEDVPTTTKLRRARAFLEGAIAAAQLLDPTRVNETIHALIEREKTRVWRSEDQVRG